MSIPTDALHQAAAHADLVRLRVNKLELLERLADDLAHEIKNPLHSMVINLEVLKRRAARVAGDGAEDLQRYAGVLATELERVNRRIELLLRMSRPGRGAEVATLGELLEELLELIQLEARHHEAALDYEPSLAPVRVRLSRELGRQLILNLVLEALEGAAPGSRLRIALGARDGEARVELTCTGEHPVEPADRAVERRDILRALAAAAGGSATEVAPGHHLLTLPLAQG